MSFKSDAIELLSEIDDEVRDACSEVEDAISALDDAKYDEARDKLVDVVNTLGRLSNSLY